MKYDEVFNAANQFMKLAATTDAKGKSFAIFQADSPKVLDKKDHFSLKTETQAQGAVDRVCQYKKVPSWYDGTLKSLFDTVCRKVHTKYQNIKIPDFSKKD